MRPNIVSKLPWGVSLSAGTHGTTKAQGFRGMSAQRPHLVGFTSTGSAAAFLLPNNYPIASDATTNVYVVTVNGSASAVVNSASSLSVLQFSSNIADTAKIVCLYGTSGTA
jgi:hypothetical protein